MVHNTLCAMGVQHVARRAGVSDTGTGALQVQDSRTELLDYDLNDTHMNTHTQTQITTSNMHA